MISLVPNTSQLGGAASQRKWRRRPPEWGSQGGIVFVRSRFDITSILYKRLCHVPSFVPSNSSTGDEPLSR